MSPFSFDYPPGATPLDPNEVEGLIPDYITTQGELNALERENILEAGSWAHDRKHADILNATFALDLHRRMFYRVWKWAGTQRKSAKNIGVSWNHISTELAQLLGNVKYWIENRLTAGMRSALDSTIGLFRPTCLSTATAGTLA